MGNVKQTCAFGPTNLVAECFPSNGEVSACPGWAAPPQEPESTTPFQSTLPNSTLPNGNDSILIALRTEPATRTATLYVFVYYDMRNFPMASGFDGPIFPECGQMATYTELMQQH
jgi:hypothetical protein